MRPNSLRYNQRCMSVVAKDEAALAGTAGWSADFRREFQAVVSGCVVYRLDGAYFADRIGPGAVAERDGHQ